uniref:uncharacterized protein LOC104266813 isoform X2 n=1 Tax=Ciona intestinalis TaxID=7719 RepID=UPI00089DD3A8|nr:uncharacterized protein LOC104266813 isoform X2 [Ciona intestinalis]|eukprot:XP_009862217.2 uncharacterized protein LOC104266813 isoform X2 [Ciona intestinalis]
MTAIATAFTAYDMQTLHGQSFQDYCSVNSSDEDRGSDYSLSDIEDGLSSTSAVTKWPTDIPVVVNKKAYNLPNHANHGQPAHRKLCRAPILTNVWQRQVSMNTSRRRNSSQRHSAHRLPAQQTLKFGVQQIAHLFENISNKEKVVAPTTCTTMKTMNIPNKQSMKVVKLASSPGQTKLPVINSPVNRKQSLSRIRIQFPSPSHIDIIRDRSQSYSGVLDSPRSRCSSVLSTNSLKIDSDAADSNVSEEGGSHKSVKQWKHYKRAMEAYRKSAQRAKAKAAAANQEPGSTKVDSPLHSHSIFERGSIYDLWDNKSHSSTPTVEDEGMNTDLCSDFGSSRHSDEYPIWNGNSPVSPSIRDWNYSVEDTDHLSLDYRTLMASNKPKNGWMLVQNAVTHRGVKNEYRKSMEPDSITDIDALMMEFDEKVSSKDDDDECNEKTSFDLTQNKTNSPSLSPVSPEKIVWPEYEKLVKAKFEVCQHPNSSFKMRLAALEKKGVKSMCSFEQDMNEMDSDKSRTSSTTDTDMLNSNLRDKSIIRKRNLSLSNSYLNQRQASDMCGETKTFSQHRHYHTVASPARLSKLLRKQAKQRILSPLSSPKCSAQIKTEARPFNRRTASLGDPCNASLDENITLINDEDENLFYTEDVFPLPSPASLKDTSSSINEFNFPSPPPEFTNTFNDEVVPGSHSQCEIDTALVNKDAAEIENNVNGVKAFFNIGCNDVDSITSSTYINCTDVGQNPVILRKNKTDSSINASSNLSPQSINSKRASWLYSNIQSSSFENIPTNNDSSAASNGATTYMNVTHQSRKDTKVLPQLEVAVPKIVVTRSPKPDQRKLNLNLKKKSSLYSAMAISEGRVYQNSDLSPNEYSCITTPGSESEGDYVNYESFYKKLPPKSKSASCSPEGQRKHTDYEELDPAKILPKNVSKLELDIDGYFSSLGRKKLSPRHLPKFLQSPTLSRFTSRKKSCAGQQPTNATISSNQPLMVNSNTNTNNSSEVSSVTSSLGCMSVELSPSTSHCSSSIASSGQIFTSVNSIPNTKSSMFEPSVFAPYYASLPRHFRKKKKKVKRAQEISVPLTECLTNPSATFQLKLEKVYQAPSQKLDLISAFINKEPIQSVGVGEVDVQIPRKQPVTKSYSTSNIFSGMTKVLKLNRLKTRAAVHQQQQSSYNQQPAAPVHVEIKPQIEDGKKAKKGKKKKGKLTKADISMPSGFKHVGHVGWDPNKGFDTNNMDPDVKELFNNAGVTEDDMHDKEKAQFIYDFIEKRGGIDAVKQEQKQRGAPPPPPQRGTGGGPPPPPPQRGGPPPPPRKDASRSQPPPPHRSQGPPPPPPDRGNRQAQTPQPPRGREPPVLGGRMSHPPPPPRAPESIPPPPPPSASYAPPPPPSMPSNVPPPPPPPPPSSSAPPPPPPATGMGRGALLQQIRQGTGLKSASEPVKTTNRPAATGRDALLDDIRKGGIGGLKSVSHEQNDKPVASPPPEEGLAGALARALQKRENAIHSDSESDSDNEDFDDEEWSD